LSKFDSVVLALPGIWGVPTVPEWVIDPAARHEMSSELTNGTPSVLRLADGKKI
jgi:hypothetical protein